MSYICGDFILWASTDDRWLSQSNVLEADPSLECGYLVFVKELPMTNLSFFSPLSTCDGFKFMLSGEQQSSVQAFEDALKKHGAVRVASCCQNDLWRYPPRVGTAGRTLCNSGWV
jgi:hypothetical protein